MILRPTPFLVLGLALAAASPSVAAVQAAPVATATTTIAPGTAVVDPAGAAVGTVTSVKGDQLIVKTDKYEVQIPAASFTPDRGKLIFALPQAQLNAQTEQTIAAANAKLVPGASVYGQAGSLAGTITAIDDTSVTIKLTSGKVVRVPRNAIAPGANGAVMGMSAADLQKLADQAS